MSDSQPQSSAGPNRRDVLAGMAGLTVVILSPATASAALSGGWTPLLRASQKLTGIPLDLSYLDLAQTVWTALLQKYGEDALTKLVQAVNDAPEGSNLKDVLKGAGLLEVGQAVTSLWYTGAPSEKDQPALFYNDALMWRACAFTKPPATCGGPFGYWEQPYQPAGTDKI